jgi:hypothetical protein
VKKRRMLVDQKSYDLAEHFLSGHAGNAAANRLDLAEHIQWSVEMYLESWDGSRFMTFRQE